VERRRADTGKAQSAGELTLEDIELLRQSSLAWKLLSSANVAFTASFFHRVFVAGNQREVPEQELLARLDSYKQLLNEGAGAGSAGGSGGAGEPRFPRSSREYLADWTSDEHGWLRRYYPVGQDQPHYDITPPALAAVNWLAEQQPSGQMGFIGTESRLLTVFQLFKQIVEGSEADPEQRIAALERQRAEIDAQIEQVRAGRFSVFDATQVRERFFQAQGLAREIQADFRAVEQNFRELDRQMREKVSQWQGGKGELLAEVFESQDGIAGSEQGKSFLAFWRFLMSPDTQEQLQGNVEAVLAMEPVQELANSVAVRGIQRDWVDAGSHVQDTVMQLNGQLRRYVDENYLEQERRILGLARDIEGAALKLRGQKLPGFSMAVDAAKPQLNLPLDRPLWRRAERPVIEDADLELDEGDFSLAALYELVYVDTQQLRDNIDRQLQLKDSVTLSEVLEQHPLQKGLSELVGYLAIAADRRYLGAGSSEQACYQWQDSGGRRRAARMDEVVFHRADSGTPIPNLEETADDRHA